LKELETAKSSCQLDPKNLAKKQRLKICRRNLQSIINKEEDELFEGVLGNIGALHPSQRMKITYDIYRRHKQIENRKTKQHYIPMSKWEEELKKSQGPKIALHLHEKIEDLEENPTKEEIRDIISRMRNGTAPGVDQIVTNLIKAAPTEILDELHKHICLAWRENIIQPSWTQTVQVPIPKKKTPKTINDYRRISICCTMYRIYASFLLDRLDNKIEELGNYQAAFLNNRSTDDHMFTLRRILDENWREGTKTYVMALDIEKAFDTVDLNALKDILTTRTNHTLTNRIIKGCMNESTCIKWFGQQSDYVNKGKGVKQGCPLSPRLFTLVMDDVLKTLAEEVDSLELNQDYQINLPVILSFADDLIIVSPSINNLNEILTKIKPLLASVGLHINETKTQIIIRDPIHNEILFP
jgi:hypothetical protein